MPVIPSCSDAVFLDDEFAMEDSLTKVGDLPVYSQLLFPACFMASNAFSKLPGAPGLVTSITPPEVCMLTHADPALLCSGHDC